MKVLFIILSSIIIFCLILLVIFYLNYIQMMKITEYKVNINENAEPKAELYFRKDVHLYYFFLKEMNELFLLDLQSKKIYFTNWGKHDYIMVFGLLFWKRDNKLFIPIDAQLKTDNYAYYFNDHKIYIAFVRNKQEVIVELEIGEPSG